MLTLENAAERTPSKRRSDDLRGGRYRLGSSCPPVRQRLSRAEQELRVQFTRIAQLQAQLDVVLGALLRSPDEYVCGEWRPTIAFRASRLNDGHGGD